MFEQGLSSRGNNSEGPWSPGKPEPWRLKYPLRNVSGTHHRLRSDLSFKHILSKVLYCYIRERHNKEANFCWNLSVLDRTVPKKPFIVSILICEITVVAIFTLTQSRKMWLELAKVGRMQEVLTENISVSDGLLFLTGKEPRHWEYGGTCICTQHMQKLGVWAGLVGLLGVALTRLHCPLVYM